MKDYTEFEAHLDKLLSEEENRKQEKRKLAKELFKSIKTFEGDSEARKRIYRKYQLFINASDITDNTLRGILSKGWRMDKIPSFRELITLDTCRRKASKTYSAWPLNNKPNAVKFVDMLKVERPKVYQESTTLDKLEIKEYPSIIKPLYASTSQGVVIALSTTKFKIVRNGAILESIDEVKQRLQRALDKKAVGKDVWQLEELIADVNDTEVRPARDLKFYCFYGEVGQVLEVERARTAQYRTRYPDGSFAEGAEFKENLDFPVTDFTKEDVELAKRISREIPAPFVRIDFLKTDDRMLFCEFTPRPGQYGFYKTEFDAYMGHMYLAAEARLQKDLFEGKTFSMYKEYLDKIK